MNDKFKQAYMETAYTFGKLSSSKRLQVGAIIVKNSRIISIGYNGMPSGWTNDCEYTELDWDEFGITKEVTHTKPEVLHAETNAIAKLARSTESGEGADLFCTHTPCLECAKLIYQSGISTLYFNVNYRLESGIEFLEKSGVKVEKIYMSTTYEIRDSATQ